MRLARSLGVVLTLGFTLGLGLAGRASARSCIRNAYERLQVEAVAVFEGTREVKAPPELEPLDTLYNSGGARGLLFWYEPTMGFAKFYRLERAFPPAPAVAEYLARIEGRSLRTSCGYSVPYTPIVPGRYLFEQEHHDGARVSKGIAEPELWVAPGRDVVELRFRVGDRRYRAVYKVRCADFKWTPEDQGRCAPTEASEDLDQVFARTDAAPGEAGAGEPVAEPASDGALADGAAPASEPHANEPPSSAPREPAPIERGCAVDEAGAPALLFAALILARRPRSRRRRARAEAPSPTLVVGG